MRDISNAKQEIINFRKVIRPQRPVLRDLERTKQRYLAEDIDIYFDDINDASERIWDMLENYKEVVEALEDTNESVLSHRVNEVLRVLTAFSVVILPLTLIASIWGMNVGFPGEGTVGRPSGRSIAAMVGAAGRDARVLPPARLALEQQCAQTRHAGQCWDRRGAQRERALLRRQPARLRTSRTTAGSSGTKRRGACCDADASSPRCGAEHPQPAIAWSRSAAALGRGDSARARPPSARSRRPRLDHRRRGMLSEARRPSTGALRQREPDVLGDRLAAAWPEPSSNPPRGRRPRVSRTGWPSRTAHLRPDASRCGRTCAVLQRVGATAPAPAPPRRRLRPRPRASPAWDSNRRR